MFNNILLYIHIRGWAFYWFLMGEFGELDPLVHLRCSLKLHFCILQNLQHFPTNAKMRAVARNFALQNEKDEEKTEISKGSN